METIVKSSYRGKQRVHVDVPAGTTTKWIKVDPNGCSAVVAPGSGGTMRIEITHSPALAVDEDNLEGTSKCIPVVWISGEMSDNEAAEIIHATAVRFVATTADGIGEIAE